MIAVRRLRTSRVIPRKNRVNKAVGPDASIPLKSLPKEASNIAVSLSRQSGTRKHLNKKNDKTENQCYNAKRKMFHINHTPKEKMKMITIIWIALALAFCITYNKHYMETKDPSLKGYINYLKSLIKKEP